MTKTKKTIRCITAIACTPVVVLLIILDHFITYITEDNLDISRELLETWFDWVRGFTYSEIWTEAYYSRPTTAPPLWLGCGRS